MSNYHGHDTRDTAGISAAMMFMVLLAVGAIVVIAVLAWNANDNDNDNIVPGQGGQDVPGQVSTPSPSNPTLPQINPTVPSQAPGGNATPPTLSTPAR